MTVKLFVCLCTSYDVHCSHCHQDAEDETKHIHVGDGHVYETEVIIVGL